MDGKVFSASGAAALVWFALVLGAVSPAARAQISTHDQPCAGTNFGGNLGCTANDVSVLGGFRVQGGGAITCQAGEDVIVDLEAVIVAGNASRYDIAMFVGETANDPQLAATGVNNQCTVTTLPTSPLPLASPFAELDGDACGDIDTVGGDNQETLYMDDVRIRCNAGPDGRLIIPYVLTWKQSGDNQVCNNPPSPASALAPGAVSKCNTAPVATPAVIDGAVVLGYVQIDKATVPAGVAQSFDFTAASTTAGVTPSQSAFSMTDAAAPVRITIPVNSTGRNLTITESAIAGWDLTGLTCTTASGGSAAGFVTVNTATRQVSATLSSTNAAVHCTYTNTRQTRVRTVKALSPITDPGLFNLTAGPTTVNDVGNNGSTGFTAVAPGVSRTFGETAGTGTALANYTTTYVCTDNTTGTQITSGTGTTVSFVPPANGDTTCTFTNTRRTGAVTLTKAWTTPTAGDTVSLAIGGASGAVAGSSVAPSTATPATATGNAGDTITVSEAFGVGNPASYATTLACVRTVAPLTAVATSGAGLSRTFVMPADSGVACTWSNTGPAADIAVTKSAPTGGAFAGQTVSWNLVVTNNGPATATNIVVTDTPSNVGGIVLSSATPGCSGGSCTFASLANGASITITATGTVTAAGAFDNSVSAIANTFDPDTTDNTDATGNGGNAGPAANLSISKSNGGSSVDAGGTTQYVVRVTNNGPSSVTGAVLTDAAATGLTKTTVACSATPGQCTAPATPSVAQLEAGYALPALANGQFYEIVVTATVGTEASVSNTATIAVPGGTLDPDSGNDASTDTDTVDPVADLTLVKAQRAGTSGAFQTTPLTVSQGDTVQYQLTIANDGPSAAGGATFTDAVPAGFGSLAVISAVGANGATNCAASFAGNTLGGTFSGPAGATCTVIVQAVANDAAASPGAVNTASTTLAADPTPASSSVNTIVGPSANLVVTKSDGVTTVSSGTSTVYTVRVANNGPASVTGAVVTDPAASGLAKTATACTAAGGNACSAAPSIVALEGSGFVLPALASGDFFEFTVTATVTAASGDDVSNTASVAPPGGVNDPTPGNNSTTDTNEVGALADLAVTKTQRLGASGAFQAAPLAVFQGDLVQYRILIENDGPSAAAGATFSDPLPANFTGVAFVSATPAGGATCSGSVAGNTLSGSFDGPAGSSCAVIVQGTASTVAAGGVTNTASTTLADDPTPATSSVSTVIGPTANLSVVKSNGASEVVSGADTTYVVRVENAGPSSATGAVLRDPATAGLTKVSAACTASAGNACGSNPGIGALEAPGGVVLPAIPAGGFYEITVTATVDATNGSVSNAASITAPAGTNDPVGGDDSAQDTDTVGSSADLAFGKAIDVASPTVGDTVVFTLTVSNAGPSAASGVVVTDQLPAGYTHVSDTGGGAYVPGTGVWTVGTVNAGGNATLAITATVNAAGSHTNAAQITASGTPDPDSTPNDGGGDDFDSVTPGVDFLPDAVNDSAGVDEDDSVNVSVLGNDSFGDDGAGSLALATPPADGTAVLDDAGTSADPTDDFFVYTPDADFNGSDSFTYTITDGNGDADTATVTIAIGAVNDAPDAVDDAVSVNQDASATVIDVLGNDTDVDADTLTVTAVTQPANGTVTLVGGVVSFEPAPGFTGTTTFTYTISDGNGGTDTATVTVTVDNVNDAPDAGNDSYSMAEDSVATVLAPSVLDNDTDADAGTTLTITGNTNPSNGTVSCSATDCTYTPNANFHGTDTFTYTIGDGDGGSDTATVTITVTPVNDAPDANDDTLIVAEDAPATPIDVLLNDGDVDAGTTLTITGNTNAANGTVSCTATGCTYQPDADFNGTDSFTYTISDGEGGSDTATVTITVGGSNDAPVAADDSYTLAEDGGVTLLAPSVLDNDNDGDGDTLSIQSNTAPANGTVACTATDCTYTANADFTGSDAFTYTVSDGNGGTATATVSITVTPVNDAPDALDDGVSVNQDAAPTVIDVLGNDTDVDTGTTLTVTAVTQPANGTVTLTGGVVSFEPAPGFVGTTTFTYTISDGNGGTDTATVTITVDNVNDAPEAENDSYSMAEDGGATLLAPSVLDNDSDADAGDAFTITSNTSPTSGTVSCTATDCTYTPNADFHGTDSFTYTITDAGGATDTATVTITVTPVNDAPNAENDSYTVAEDSGATVLAPSVLDNDTDVDTGDTRAITSNTNPTNGTVICTATDCTYTPNADFTGTDSFTYTITDAGGATDTATVTITVTPVNDAPDAADDTASVNQDAAPTVIDVLGNDTDVDTGTTLTVTAVTQPANGTVALVGGVVSFEPAPGFVGTTTFTYTISDGNGGTDTATVTVTVDNVNDAPDAIDDSYSVAEDSGATVLSPPVLDNDTDTDAGDTFTITSNSGSANGTVSCTATDCTYTPGADFTGTDSFTYTITDAGGATDTATVTITVTPMNDAPNAADDSYTVAEDSGATVLAPSVLDNDTDADTGDTRSITANTGAANGTVNCTATDCTYTPDADFTGTDSFTYTITDAGGATDTAMVTITVTPANDAPDAVDDAASVNQDAAATVIDVLGNDTDADTGTTLTVTAVTQPANGTVTLVGGVVSFEPAPGFVGTTTFTYTISDGNGGTDTATVTVTVDNVNDAPNAVDDGYTLAEDSGATVLTPSVLDNDTDADAGDTRSITANTAPGNGAVSCTASDCTYTPDADFNGTDSFTYTITDGSGATDTATVTITVTPVNDAPDAVEDSLIVAEDAPATPIDVLLNDGDVDAGTTLTITGNTNPANGTVTCTATGCSYQPDADFNGTDSFTYTISDGNGGTDTATVTITVGGDNDAPVAGDDGYTVAEDSGATLLIPSVLDNDNDADNDTLSILSNTAPANGSVACTATDCTYTPDADFTGSDAFTYTVSDGNGGTATATVTITVTPVNDAPDAIDDLYTVAEDSGATTLAPSVLDNDSDIDVGDTLAITSNTGAASGTVNCTATDCTYTPDPDFTGTDSFTYTIIDGSGVTDTATVTVTVTPANDAPDAVDDAVSVNQDAAATVIDVLGNDTDVDAGTTLTVTAVTQPANGTVTLVGGVVSFEPAPGFVGTTTFTYTISDGNGGTDTATVTVTVDNVNDAPEADDDGYTVAEDSGATLLAPSVLLNDSDVDAGDTFAITSNSGAANGTVSCTATDCTYTPDADFTGTDSFTYTVTDGSGATDTATVTITVTPVNDTPDAIDDAASVNQDASATVIDVLGNDTDIENDTLTVTAVTQPVSGTVTLVGGVVSFEPAPGFVGTTTFTYTISDGNGGTDTATVTVTVDNVNDAPEADDDGYTVAEDSGATLLAPSVLLNDSDVDVGDTLAITSNTGAANGTVSCTATDCTYTPDADFTGSDSFTYTITDAGGATDTATVTITVTPVNDAPDAIDDSYTMAEDSGATLLAPSVLDNDTDVDSGDTRTITANTNPADGTVSCTATDCTYTPDADFTGTDSFTYTITDAGGATDTATVTITVTPANDAPDAVDDAVSVNQDAAPTIIDVLGNDTDADTGTTLTVTAVTQPANGTVTLVGGVVSFEPAPGFTGTTTFTYTISDGDGGTDTATVTVTVDNVNDAPDAVDDGYTVAEDSGATLLAPSVLDNDTDPDAGDTRTITANTNPADGTVICSATDCTYTPNADFNGSDSFTYTITDGSGATDTATVTITVTPVNDAPDAVDDGYTLAEDSGATLLVPSVLDNDSDVDTGDVATITANTNPANGTVSCTATDCTYTPNADFNGTDTFTYTLGDGNGGTDTATVTLTVTPVNDAPDAVDDAVSVNQDASATVIDVLGNDTDVDADTLTVTAVTQPANGTVTLVGGVVSFEPAPGFTGTTTFTYTISDGNGGTDTATVTVTVDNVNDAPDAGNDSYSMAEDGGATLLAPSVLDNDTDADAGTTLTITGNTNPANGTVSCSATDCTYTPNANFHGTDTFTYTIGDGDGGSDTATVTITVTPVNDAPDANDDTLIVAEDAPATPIDVLLNDGDVDAGTTLTITGNTNAANGTVSCTATGCTYQPDADFNGTDSFTYTISDAEGGSDTATVTITVGGSNDAPVAADDSYTLAEDGGATLLAPSVLDNDNDGDGDTLSIQSNTTPANGTVACTATDCTYTPNADFNGTDSFTYTVSDGNGGTATATVSITVTPVNDAPDALDNAYSVAQDAPATLLDVRANDTDVDGDTLSVTGVTQPADGTVTFTATDVSFTPAAGFVGTTTFTYTIDDGNSGTDTATVTVTIDNVNDVPNAQNDSYTVAEDSGATVLTPSVLANDTDADVGDTLTITANTSPASGTVSCSATDCTYTPNADFTGTDSFTYTITDGSGGTDTATVTITVTPVNDAPDAVDDSYTMAEDSGATVLTPSVLANDTDIDAGTTLTVSAVTQPADGSASFTPADVSFTPDAGFSGTTSFTYTVSDGNGGSATATVTVTVTGVNDAPDAVDDALGVPEDAPATAVDVLANDSDADQGDSLSILSNTPAANGTAACTPTQCTYQPNAGFAGSDSFTYTITDLAGGTDTATVTIDVGGTNDAPLATDDAYTVGEDSGATLLLPAVLANDSDPDGDTLSITANTAPANGIVACTASDCTYTPNDDFNGADSFTYTIGDGSGGSDTATVTITVSAVDDLPVANDDAAATAAATPVSGDAALNDVASGDGGNAWSLTGADGGATLGTVTMTAAGSYTYTPDADASGTDSFAYELCDVDGDCDAATVTVTISAAPASADLSITKLADSLIPTTGGPIAFTIEVTNTGPSAVADAVVTDLLPDGYAFVSASTSQGTYVEGSGVWTVGALASGATATLTVNATVEETGNYANTATVTSSIPDPDPSDNTATETPTPVQGAPVQADLSVEKTGPATIERGETLDFTIVLENHGPATAVNARLVDPTPAGLQFVSTSGACSGAFPCMLGDLPGGATRTVVARYVVPEDYAGPDMIVNTVNALSDTQDPTPGDSSSSSSVVVQQGVVQPPLPPPAPVMVPLDARWATGLMIALLALFAGRGLRRERLRK